MLYNNDRKKIPGLFQDECVDGEMLVISEYIGLRAKSYVNKMYNPVDKSYETKKKSKGVNRKHLKQRTDFDDYRKALNGEKIILSEIYGFKAKGLQTYSILQTKVALCGKDDKRILQENNRNTYAIGHYKIN